MIADFLKSSSSPSESEEVEHAEVEHAEVEHAEVLRRRSRTEAARAASRLSKQAKKLASSSQEPRVDSKVDTFREYWFSGTSTTRPELRAHWSARVAERSKAICLYVTAFAQRVREFILGDSGNLQHVISTNIVDDVELVGPTERGARWSKKSVMNNIQDVYVRHDPCSGSANPNAKLNHFRVHQPFMLLESSTGQGIWSQFVAWLLLSMDGIGHVFQHVGISYAWFSNRCRYIVTCVTHDRLRANNTIPQSSRKLVFVRNKEKVRVRHLYINVNCVIHNVQIGRRCICLFTEGYWCNLVRLGHLFESATFRGKFREALVIVIMEDFSFFCVWPHNLPDEVATWTDRRYQHLDFKTEPGKTLQKSSQLGRNFSEVQNIHRIIQVDNSDPSCETFGQIADIRGKSQRAAMLEIAGAYLARFGQGYPTPLLQRWKHGDRAQKYIDDGFEFRRVLPRTLQAMSDSGKQDKLRSNISEILGSAMRTNLQLRTDGEDHGEDDSGQHPDDVQSKINALMEQILGADQMSAQQNLSRLKSCTKYFRGSEMHNTVTTTSAFLSPIDYCCNRLFHRSGLLFKLQVELDSASRQKMESESLGAHILNL